MSLLDKIEDPKDRKLYVYVAQKKACTMTEAAAFYEGLPPTTPTKSLPKSLQRKPARKALGRLQAKDLIVPCTTFHSRAVYYMPKPSSWPAPNPNMVRAQSKREHPDLWPVDSTAGGGRTKEWWTKHVVQVLTASWQGTNALAKAAEMRSMTIRRYLQNLEQEGVVESREHRTGQRGRPGREWRMKPDVTEVQVDKAAKRKRPQRKYEGDDESMLVVDFSKMTHRDKYDS